MPIDQKTQQANADAYSLASAAEREPALRQTLLELLAALREQRDTGLSPLSRDQMIERCRVALAA